MTSSEQTPPRARRRGLLWLVLALLVAFGLYSAGWFWLAGKVRSQAALTVAALNDKGIDADCANLNVSGYPLRFVVTCDSLAYEDDARKVAASSGKLNVVATILGPFSPSAEFRGPLRTTAPGMPPLWIDWDHLRADAGLSWPTPTSVRLTAEGLSGQTDPEEGDPISLFSAGQAQTELRPNGMDLVASGRFDDVEIDAQAIGGRMVPVFDAAGEATLKNGVAVLQAGAKSLRGQAIDIANLQLSSGEARVALSGPVSVDADGLIDARLTIKLTNPKAVAAVLAGIVPEQKRQIEQGFAALAMLGSAPSMPLLIAKGKASLGFIPLGNIKPIGE